MNTIDSWNSALSEIYHRMIMATPNAIAIAEPPKTAPKPSQVDLLGPTLKPALEVEAAVPVASEVVPVKAVPVELVPVDPLVTPAGFRSD